MRRSSFVAGLIVSGLLVGCTGDAFGPGGEGGGGGGVTSSTGTGVQVSSGSGVTSSSTGSGCTGCIDGSQVCHEELTAELCGLPGGTCAACPAPPPCQEAFCDGVTPCATRPLADGSGCVDQDGAPAACVAGVCTSDAEICLNDEDEDDDDLVGCADTEDCSDFSCSDASTNGWAGPFLVLAGDAQATCPLGLEPAGLAYGSPKGTCECDLDVPCALEVDTAPTCGGATTQRDVGTECDTLGVSSPFGLDAIRTVCTASDDAVEDPSFTVLTACELPAGGCNPGQVCQPPLPPAEEDYLLCLRTDELPGACPVGFTAQVREVVLQPPTVECSCTCSLPQGDGDGACTGTLFTSPHAGCGECGKAEVGCNAIPVPADAGCETILGAANTLRAELQIAEAGEPAIVAAPVFAGGPTHTYCCQPYENLP